MVVFKLLISVLRAELLDDRFHLGLFAVGSLGVEDIDRILLGDREGSVHLLLHLFGHTRFVRVLLDVESLQFVLLALFRYVGKNFFLETGLFDTLGNKKSGLLLTHYILYSDTVLDLLDLDLLSFRSFDVAVYRQLITLGIGILDNDLGEELVFHVFCRRGACLAYIIGVGKKDVAGLCVLDADLAGVGLIIKLITVPCQHQGHGCQLILLRLECVVEIIDSFLFAAVVIRSVRRKYGEEGERGERTEYHTDDHKCR